MIKKGTERNSKSTKEDHDFNLACLNNIDDKTNIRKDFEEALKMSKIIGPNFDDEFRAIVKEKKINVETFEEKTLRSRKTYDRLMKGKIDSPSLKVVMDICIGLNIPYSESNKLVELAGYKFTNSLKSVVYQMFLKYASSMTVEQCRSIIKALGLEKS